MYHSMNARHRTAFALDRAFDNRHEEYREEQRLRLELEALGEGTYRKQPTRYGD